MSREKRPALWTCPACGAKFVNKNQWHSCGRKSLQDWRDEMGPQAQGLFDRFESIIAACGDYEIAPAKTRISFMGRTRFANITSLSENGMTCNFALPRPLQSDRFSKIEEVVPGWWVHHLRITNPQQLDDEVQQWVLESYQLMGMQERLD